MRVVVCVPWRPGDPERRKAWRFVRREWERLLDWPIFTGDVPGEFSRSAARNAAVRNAGDDWDCAVILDADSFPIDGGRMWEAAREAYRLGRLVIPHHRYHYLSESESRAWMTGLRLPLVNDERVRQPGGVIIVPRPLWELTRGYDERFIGWGGEDTAFIEACRTLGGRKRMPGHIVHLWHPESAVDPDEHIYNRTLRHLYREAAGNREAMLKVIADR